MSHKVIPVDAIGERETVAFLCGGPGAGLRKVKVTVYPPSPRGKAFRQRRVSLGLSLAEAAGALGIGVVYLSNVERGSMVFENWDAAEKAIDEAAGASNG